MTEVMTEGRTRFPGSRMYLRNDGMRGAVRALREGVPFYFLPDMDLGPRDAVFVPFFGVSAATVTSVERLARLTNASVLPLVTTMTSTGYVAKFYPPWQARARMPSLEETRPPDECLYRATGHGNAGAIFVDPQTLQDQAARRARSLLMIGDNPAMKLKFSKMQGAGNDFVVIDAVRQRVESSP